MEQGARGLPSDCVFLSRRETPRARLSPPIPPSTLPRVTRVTPHGREAIALPPATRHIRKRVKAFARVFALAPDCHTAGRYMRVWQRHFYDGLKAALPSVVLPVAVDFGWARPATAAPLGPSRDRGAMSERLWDQIRSAHTERGLGAVTSY